MAISWPASPDVGDRFTPPGVNRTFEWDGEAWRHVGDASQNPGFASLRVYAATNFR